MALAGSMFLTVADVFLRTLKRPIVGTYELVGLLGALVVGFAIPQTSRLQGHVLMDFVTAKLSAGIQRVLQVITRILAMGLFAVIGWNMVNLGNDFRRVGEVTPPFSCPFTGSLRCRAVLPGRVLCVVRRHDRKERHGIMSFATIGLLVILLLFFFFLMGLEIGFSMALAGFIGFAAIVNVDAALNLVAKDIYSVLSSYGFTVIPMFVLMGQGARAAVWREACTIPHTSSWGTCPAVLPSARWRQRRRSRQFAGPRLLPPRRSRRSQCRKWTGTSTIGDSPAGPSRRLARWAFSSPQASSSLSMGS